MDQAANAEWICMTEAMTISIAGEQTQLHALEHQDAAAFEALVRRQTRFVFRVAHALFRNRAPALKRSKDLDVEALPLLADKPLPMLATGSETQNSKENQQGRARPGPLIGDPGLFVARPAFQRLRLPGIGPAPPPHAAQETSVGLRPDSALQIHQRR
jgi:hypothetical protein